MFLIFCVLSICVVSARANSCSSSPVPNLLAATSNMYLANSSYLYLTNTPRIQCAVRCMRQRKCASFNYYINASDCELNKETHITAPESLTAIQAGDIDYYAISQWDQILLGDCQNHDCATDDVCVGVKGRNGPFICISSNGRNATTDLQSNTTKPEVPTTTVSEATASTTDTSAPTTATSYVPLETTTKHGTTDTTTDNDAASTTSAKQTTTTAVDSDNCTMADGCANCMSTGVVNYRNYYPFGCFPTIVPTIGASLLSNLLFTFYIEYDQDYAAYYEAVVRRCAEAAGDYNFFGIGEFFGCFAGNDVSTEGFNPVVNTSCDSICVKSGVGVWASTVTFVYEWGQLQP